MTPREKMIAALNFQPYEGRPPHIELEFQLTREVFGEDPLDWNRVREIPKLQLRDALIRNVQLWIKVAEKYDYSDLPGLHWLGLNEAAQSFQIARELSGDRYLLKCHVDGTLAIPDGANYANLSYRIADDFDGLLEELDRNCENACRTIEAFAQAGAEINYMCSDYCFNQGPFLSPNMFRKLVTPFLKRQCDTCRKVGMYGVKHTDGNLNPILDQMIECHPHAFHSIDPMAGMDIREVRRQVGKKIALIGNVDCSKLQSGTKQEIEESARYCLKYGPIDHTGYVFASSNCIFRGVPLESYDTMLAVRNSWEDN